MGVDEGLLEGAKELVVGWSTAGRVANEPGAGAQRKNGDSREEADTHHAADASFSVVQLLLIEDDDDLAQLLTRYLGRSGFVVTRVSDGDAGVDAFLAARRTPTPFDIVVTDGLLPRQNGLQVAHAIRAVDTTVPLVLVSAAFRNERARSDALDGGFDAYFGKPFVLGDLRDALVKLATRPKPSTTPVAVSTTTPQPFRVARRRSSVAVPTTTPVNGMPGTARVLLTASRARLDGVVEFLGTSEGRVRVAFLGGVVVGARDDKAEHQLGPWLVARGRLTVAQGQALDARLTQTNERVAEALLALGFVTGAEALALVEAQARARLQHVLPLAGTASIRPGLEEARSLAVGVIELVEEILQAGLAPGARLAADTFLFARADDAVERTVDFDSGLVALARLRPTSTLPNRLLEGCHVFGDFNGDDGQALYAMWLAGLVRASSEPPSSKVTLPRATSSTSRDAFADRALVDEVAAVLLKARGASIYRLLGVPPETSTEMVRQRLLDLVRRYGRAALRDAPLGPARAAATELQGLLEEAVFAFSDERRRRAWDEDHR